MYEERPGRERENPDENVVEANSLSRICIDGKGNSILAQPSQNIIPLRASDRGHSRLLRQVCWNN
jgi:uncharacterized protein (DUF2235 family)